MLDICYQADQNRNSAGIITFLNRSSSKYVECNLFLNKCSGHTLSMLEYWEVEAL